MKIVFLIMNTKAFSNLWQDSPENIKNQAFPCAKKPPWNRYKLIEISHSMSLSVSELLEYRRMSPTNLSGMG